MIKSLDRLRIGTYPLYGTSLNVQHFHHLLTLHIRTVVARTSKTHRAYGGSPAPFASSLQCLAGSPLNLPGGGGRVAAAR